MLFSRSYCRVPLGGGFFCRSYASKPTEGGYGRSMKTEPVHAADILYRNPEAINNRLELFHLLRLQRQHQLDKEKLSEMTKEYSDKVIIKDAVRVSILNSSREPGCEKQFNPKDAAVTIAIPFKVLSSKLKHEEMLKFKGMLGARAKYNIKKQRISFTVNDFPFISQNRIRALETLKALVEESKRKTTICDLNADINTEEVQRRRRKKRPSLEFPEKWLQTATRAN